MAKIALVGDIAFTGIVSSQPENNPIKYKQVGQILDDFELVFGNLEVPVKVSEEANEYKKFVHYSLPDPTKKLLAALNISCVSLANNHIYDSKMSGLKATIDMLDELGIKHTGAGWRQDHIEPVIIEKDDIKVGFIAYVDQSTNPKTEYFPELFINYFEPEKVKKEIEKLKPGVDRLICSIHWGVDYSYYPTPNQIEIAHQLSESGVDIIMGHHAHTIQPFEIFNKSTIFYNLGTFIFGDIKRPSGYSSLPIKTKRGIIAKFDLESNQVSFKGFKILKFGYFLFDNFDFIKWSAKINHWNKLRIRYILVGRYFIFKEAFLDRFIDFLFGYYRKPLQSLFSFRMLKKLQNSYSEINRLKKIK